MTSTTGAPDATGAGAVATGEMGKPFGPAAAAILGGAIGCFILGLMTTLAEASTGFADGLDLSSDVGPLSGKTIIAAGAFFASWGVLALFLRARNPSVRTVLWISAALLAAGVLMTFPTFFQVFAPD